MWDSLVMFTKSEPIIAGWVKEKKIGSSAM